jgi:hypothetical protein
MAWPPHDLTGAMKKKEAVEEVERRKQEYVPFHRRWQHLETIWYPTRKSHPRKSHRAPRCGSILQYSQAPQSWRDCTSRITNGISGQKPGFSPLQGGGGSRVDLIWLLANTGAAAAVGAPTKTKAAARTSNVATRIMRVRDAPPLRRIPRLTIIRSSVRGAPSAIRIVPHVFNQRQPAMEDSLSFPRRAGHTIIP